MQYPLISEKEEQTGKCYALTCFTEEREGRTEIHHQIADALKGINSTYVTLMRYMEIELFVDCNCEENEFVVLLMDWIDGETMETYVADNYHSTRYRESKRVVSEVCKQRRRYSQSMDGKEFLKTERQATHLV